MPRETLSQTEFLRRLVEQLQSAGIAYMVVGSLASSIHGEPRATNDVDLVVGASAAQLERFVEALAGEFYVSAEAARDAMRSNSMFNVIDFKTGWKADLIFGKDRPFDQEQFRRRGRVEFHGIELTVSSPEDTILSKLEWAKRGDSELQSRDVFGVMVAQGPSLDQTYLERWAEQLGVADRLQQLLRDAEEFRPSD